nr:acyltransferase [uncultured Rhodoferax sp.]
MKKFARSIFHSYLHIRDIIFCNISIGIYKKTWRFWGIPILSKCKNSSIEIGDYFVACSLPKNNSIGVNQRVIIKTVLPNSKLLIGSNVGISGCTISCSDSISIGNNVFIGSGVLITDSDAHSIHPDLRKNSIYAKTKPIHIGNNVFLGARSIVLKGVTIGDGSVIGAGSVVTSDIPSMSVAAGNPARVITDIKNIEYYL